jgi:transcriptional regulator with XRE-family HTH domain
MDTHTHTEIAARLRAARARAQLSQAAAGRLAGGLSYVTMCRFERGHRLPSLDTLYALADVYGVTVYDLIPPRRVLPDAANANH